MNIMRVMDLPIGSIVVNRKGKEYKIEERKYGTNKIKILIENNSKKLVNINENTIKEEYDIVRNFKRGDKVYINWFYDTEGLDEVEFLRYCKGDTAQVLIEGEEESFIGKVDIDKIYLDK